MSLLSQATISQATALLGQFIDNISAPVEVHYAPIQVPCPNCKNVQAGDSSQNFFINGGQLNSLGVCGTCGGKGTIAQEQKEIVQMTCEYNPKIYDKNGNVQIRDPNSTIQTRGRITLFPKLQQAEFIIIDLEIEGYDKYRFRMIGEPADENTIFSGQFFTANWERF